MVPVSHLFKEVELPCGRRHDPSLASSVVAGLFGGIFHSKTFAAGTHGATTGVDQVVETPPIVQESFLFDWYPREA